MSERITRWHRSPQPEEITPYRSSSASERMREGVLPHITGLRSSKRAIGAGMRAGGEAIKRAKETAGIQGDCDKIKQVALDYAQTYLEAEPELFELHATHANRRPPTLRSDVAWHDALNTLSEGGAYKVIDQEWFRMGCQKGKKMVTYKITLPREWGRLQRRMQRRMRRRV